jgi:hypothetical protein
MDESQVRAMIEAARTSMEATIAARVDQAVQQSWASFTIQNGNGISISGTGKNITISSAALSAEGSPSAISAFITVCVDNGDETFTQRTASFVNGLLVSLS